MIFRTDDPIADYDRYCEHQQKELERLPRCSICDEYIDEEYCFRINDELICVSCMIEFFRVETPID